MESTATAEQAEPQGSATPAPAASVEDFGALYRAHVEKRTPQQRAAAEPETSSAGQETSATDEQPVSDASLSGTPDASDDGAGLDPEPQPGTTDQPKLSRAQRKALKTAGQPDATAAGTDTSAQPPDASDDADPVVRVERVLNDRLGRLEALIGAPNPSQSDPSLNAASQAYLQTFGDDAEFTRRAQIAIRPSGNQFLSAEEALQTEQWATNREVKNLVDQQYRGNLSAIAIAKAKAYGLDPQRMLSTPSFDATYDVVFEHGKSLGATEGVAKAAERIGKLEATNRQLADENEALRQRAPATARRTLTGGFSTGSAGALVDKSNLSGRELMRRAMEPQTPTRPSGRARPS